MAYDMALKGGTMTLMIQEVYDAFMAAGAGEEKARAAAEAIAGYENRFQAIERKVDVLTWMAGTTLVITLANVSISVAVLLKLIGA